MYDPLNASLQIASSGLAAQSARLRVVSENIANADSTSTSPGGDPYRRQTISFAAALDRQSGIPSVQVSSVSTDPRPFRLVRDPSNPAADSTGMVKMPNVDTLLEMADMRDANRAYEADLQVVKEARDLSSQTIDLLKS